MHFINFLNWTELKWKLNLSHIRTHIDCVFSPSQSQIYVGWYILTSMLYFGWWGEAVKAREEPRRLHKDFSWFHFSRNKRILKNFSLDYREKIKLSLSNSCLSIIPAAAAKSLQSCPTLCNPIEGIPAGSPIPGILQARTLEWVAISFSNEWKWKVKVKSLSRVRLLATPWTAAHQAPLSMGFSRQEYWSEVQLPTPINYS